MKRNRTVSILIMAILIFSVSLSVSGCGTKKSSSSATITPTPVSATVNLLKSSDGKMSIDLGDKWTKNTGLWPTAQIGASIGDAPNVVVIAKPKSTFASGTTPDLFLTGYKAVFAELMTSPVWGKRTGITIDGLSGLTVQINGMSKTRNVQMVYWVSVVEDSTNFYEIVGWTPESTSKSDINLVQSVVSSFKVY